MSTDPDPTHHMIERVAQLETAQGLLRRQLIVLEDQLSDLEAHLTQLAPLVASWSIVRSGLRLLTTILAFPIQLVGMLLKVPAMTKCFKDARLRSERLIKDPHDGRWTSKLDRQAYFVQVIRAIGLSRPTIYRVNPRQRPSITRRPRVLHVIPNVWLGGSTQLILDLHDYLGHRFEMEVVTSALPAQGRHHGMRIRVLPKPPSRHEVRRIFGRFRPHIAHIHYWGDVDGPWYEAFFDIATEFGCAILQNVNTPVTPFSSVPVTRNVFVSQTMLDQFGSTTTAQVIYPGINLSMFSPPETSDLDSYDAVGMVYRLERDKLNETSIEPFIMVVKHRPQTRAIIVGDGSLLTHFRSRVREEGLLDRFEFTGYVPFESLAAHYTRFKIFVAPVWQESFGQVIPFAMSMGLAVAGNRVGAIPELLGDDSTLGITLDETASHILRLLENRDAIDVIGARNRSIARANFCVERMVTAYADIYKSLAPGEADLMPDYPPAVYFPL
jgi:glycosyltransferase involved in cell wall biosynthesis